MGVSFRKEVYGTKKIFKKFLVFGILIFSFFIQVANHAFAASATYMSSDISVVCEEDGTAHINEVWKINVNSGTEMYLGRENLENQTISNLKVSADGKEYQNVSEWDINAGLKEKAYKCAIVEKGSGYELCWGLSSYGTRIFNVSYDMTNLVKRCSDGSFIDQTFINKLSSSLKTAKITIEKKGDKFTEENSKIWAGGGATGDIFVKSGKIEAKLTAPMPKKSNFAILAQFDKGVFSPKAFENTSFEELKDKELAGTGYEKYYKNLGNDSESTHSTSSFPYLINILIIPFMFLIYFIFHIIFLKTRKIEDIVTIYKDKFRKEYKDPNYSRNLPFNNNIFATYARLKGLRKLQNECSIIGVYLLKWIQNHEVELIKVEVKKFFKTKTEDAIKLKELPSDVPPLEKSLFDLMIEASDKDRVLKNNDFKNWCRKNYKDLDKWLKKYNKKGIRDLKEIGAVVETDRKFLGFVKYKENELSETGIKLTSEMFGFKKYLENFTIINEREAKEVALWKDYMVYAQLFGIADKVAEQFKNLYPRYFEEQLNMNESTNIILINSLANSYVRSAHDAYVASVSAANGHGGSFSGGGFSGSSGGGSSGVR